MTIFSMVIEMTADKDEKNIEKMINLTSAHAYLVIARRCVDNARMHLKYADMRVEEKLLADVYDILNTVSIDLRDEWEKEA